MAAWPNPDPATWQPKARRQNWDFALAKHFKMFERHSLDFRIDAFNVLNHPSFKQPSSISIPVNTTVTSTFGQITSTVNPARLIQLGAQYRF